MIGTHERPLAAATLRRGEARSSSAAARIRAAANTKAANAYRLIDQTGARLFLSGGLFLRAAGFLALAFAQDSTALVLAAAMIGTGSAAYETAAYGELARRPTRHRKFLFLVNNQALNLGVILGPALGALILVFDIRTTFIASAGLFSFGAMVARMAIRTSPPSHRGSGGVRRGAEPGRLRPITQLWINKIRPAHPRSGSSSCKRNVDA
ncbi:MFS transporter [Salinarimonas sp.]|uniref:MFS transporter n=1 Tax=Salinarimonas sp. TaxID=2766526 RepID=UPI00391C538C